MSERSVTHDTFRIERTYDAPPARVFAAWADPAIKSRWFVGPAEWDSAPYELDFRVGGIERTSGGPAGGPVISYEAHYQDIIPNERIVSTYDMHMDGSRISVSLATIEFKPEGSGTRLILTEQGAYLDGHDQPSMRLSGTGTLLDQLGAELQHQLAEQTR